MTEASEKAANGAQAGGFSDSGPGRPRSMTAFCVPSPRQQVAEALQVVEGAERQGVGHPPAGHQAVELVEWASSSAIK
jgi:hypothetical protein